MFFDVNAALGYWPFQDFSGWTARRLARQLRTEGIGGALVSPAEAILAPDPDIWNRRLIAALRRTPGLAAVPVINPMLANWRETLGHHLASPAVPAVKVIPNYHLYAADDPALDALADVLEVEGRPLLLQARIDDERNQYPLMRVAGVDLEATVRLARRHPRLPLVCLGFYFRQVCRLLEQTRNAFADLAFAETLETVRVLLATVSADRLLFGSHTPFCETRAAVLKLALADIDAADRERIAKINAQRLFRDALFQPSGHPSERSAHEN